jgi:hypothetical protein
MLWNLDYLEEEETRNTDLKKLMDMLRANGLCRFYLSHQYHKEAMAQLAKIDWNNVSQQSFQFYHSPLFLERFCFKMRTIGAVMKHFFLRCISNY